MARGRSRGDAAEHGVCGHVQFPREDRRVDDYGERGADHGDFALRGHEEWSGSPVIGMGTSLLLHGTLSRSE